MTQIKKRAEIMSVSPGIRVSPHEPSINDALIVMGFARNAPSEVTLVGIVPQTLEGPMTLSDAVSRAIPAAADAVMGSWDERASRCIDALGRHSPQRHSAA